MEAPEHPADRVGVVVLREDVGDAVRREFRSLVRFHERAPAVLKALRLDENDAGDLKPLEPERHGASALG
jgi:hypothetical protein